jgi:hypothetical protein
MSRIANAKDIPLFKRTGTVPDASGALTDYYEPMIFTLIKKEVDGFQVLETPFPIHFQGIIMPLTERQLFLKPEGQRAWSWFLLYSDLALDLKVDDVVDYLGKQTRVMTKKNWELYGYREFHLIQDWKGAGPG